MLYNSGRSNALTVLISPTFAIEATTYSITFDLKAPPGTPIRAIVRRNGDPYDGLGFDRTIIGTGAWQTQTLTFRGTTRTAQARLDFEVPSDRSISIDNIVIAANVSAPLQAFVDGQRIEVAHHPNRGRSPAPTSVYAANAADGNQQTYNGSAGSTYITAGSDLALPAGATLPVGTSVFIRTVSWLIDERRLTSYSGTTLGLDTPTSFPLLAGVGYYLTGALWMLDSPEEWLHDAATNSVYLWTADSAWPGGRVQLGLNLTGIDISSTSYVSLQEIAVRRVRTAVKMANAVGAVVSGMQLSDTYDVGIDASGSSNATIAGSTLERTGRDAIAGLDLVSWKMADGLRVTNNTITDAGVRGRNGVVTSLPIRSLAAINTGTRAYISGNRITNAGYIGIWPRANSVVEMNYVANACLVLDDCAAIYMVDAANGAITNNLIVGVPGSTDGKPPAQSYTHGVGIYLDDFVNAVTVADNTVTGADYGVQLHNAYNNTVRGNTLYANKSNQLWMQETMNRLRPNGDIYGNQIARNIMVSPAATAPAVFQSTLYSNVDDFASYSGNVYSGLLSGRMGREAWSGTNMMYTFDDWRAAKTSSGTPRLLDQDGSQITLSGYATMRITGPSIVPNGTFAALTNGWTAWSVSPPVSVISVSGCQLGACLQFQIGGAPALLISPNFSVAKGQWYRASFDLMTGTNGQSVRWVVRRGGGGSNGYESLMPAEQWLQGTTAWKKYTYTFQATDSVNARDPVTGDLGARLDFQADVGSQKFWLANIEIVPVEPIGSQLKTQFIVNPNTTSALVDCPDQGADALFCGTYVRFVDGVPVTWPYTLPALRGEAIYSRGDTLPDSDADGIADVQDLCAGTAVGQPVDSRGCAIGQTAR